MIPVMIVPILTGPQLLYRMLDSIDAPIAHLVIIDNGRALNTSIGWPKKSYKVEFNKGHKVRLRATQGRVD